MARSSPAQLPARCLRAARQCDPRRITAAGELSPLATPPKLERDDQPDHVASVSNEVERQDG